MEFKFEKPLNAEESEELVIALIEAIRNRGWSVPEWVAAKFREKVAELLARQFTGRISVSLEVWEGQVADIDVIESESAG